MKTYITSNKQDDYGNGITELVQTTPENAKEYYWQMEVDEDDVDVLKKYIDFTGYEEEKERSNERRFYGCN